MDILAQEKQEVEFFLSPSFCSVWNLGGLEMPAHIEDGLLCSVYLLGANLIQKHTNRR